MRLLALSIISSYLYVAFFRAELGQGEGRFWWVDSEVLGLEDRSAQGSDVLWDHRP
jgi:hypothetical protein